MARAQLILGELAIADRRAAEAERIFSRLAERDSKALEPRQRLLYLFSLQQRTALARAALWQMYQIRDDPRILVDLVLELLLDRQDVRGLAPELAEFVAKTPGDPFVGRAWGMDLLYQGRASEALPHLEAAARLLVNDPLGRFALAECRILLGKPVEIDEVVGRIPEDPLDAALWWLIRGRIEETTGCWTEPSRRSSERRRSQPEGREPHFRLGQLLKRLGRNDAGEDPSGPGGSHRPTDQDRKTRTSGVTEGGLTQGRQALERLGQLCGEAGMVPESRAWLEQSIKLDPVQREHGRSWQI